MAIRRRQVGIEALRRDSRQLNAQCSETVADAEHETQCPFRPLATSCVLAICAIHLASRCDGVCLMRIVHPLSTSMYTHKCGSHPHGLRYDAISRLGDPQMRIADTLRDQLEQDIVTSTLLPGTRLESRIWPRASASRARQSGGAPATCLGRAGDPAAAAWRICRLLEPSGDHRRFEVMAMLEGACGALAARRITDRGALRVTRSS